MRNALAVLCFMFAVSPFAAAADKDAPKKEPTAKQKAQQERLATQKRSDSEIQALTAEMRKVQQDYLAIRERPENYIGIRSLARALGKRLLHRSYRSIMAVKG